jgi:hypothetical protein
VEIIDNLLEKVIRTTPALFASAVSIQILPVKSCSHTKSQPRSNPIHPTGFLPYSFPHIAIAHAVNFFRLFRIPDPLRFAADFF